MFEVLNPVRSVDFLGVLVRMIFTLLCGATIGLERSYKNRSAGFRTHILVCTGATVASVTGIYLYLNLGLPTDISRIGAQVVAGLGFIGAGTIFVTAKNSLKGLTTAAGLWTTGIIGLAIGGGFYEGAVMATILVLVVQIWFSRIGQNMEVVPEFRLRILYNEKAALDDVLRMCKNEKLNIKNLQITRMGGEESQAYNAVLQLNPNQRKIRHDVMLLKIREISGVVYAEVPDESFE